MNELDILTNLTIAIVLIVGAYQFYFLPQRYHIFQPRELVTAIDEQIPFRPGWVWIYSALYYPVILFLVFTISTFKKFNYTAFSYLILLIAQLTFFFVIPIRTPLDWRNYPTKNSISIKFLALVHRYDSHTNCFPSMHVSVATLTALHLVENTYYWAGLGAFSAYAFPALISLSTLYTKQHYFIDIPAGVLLGATAFWLFMIMPQ